MEIRPVIHGRALARPAFKERPNFFKFPALSKILREITNVTIVDVNFSTDKMSFR